jgi:ADP-heptose:LPS heptosyltransferase
MGWFAKYILKENKLDTIFKRAKRNNKRRFLILWNRGLGDIPLGLYALIYRIREFIPEAQITFITRKNLEDAFYLLDEAINVISVSWWYRRVPMNMKDTFKRLNIKENDYDIFLKNLNPTKWLSWQIGKLTPKLKWKDQYDKLCEHFNLLESSHSYIGVHLNTETNQFYRYQKDWPAGNWRTLFERLSEVNIQVVLFGHYKTESFDLPSVIDLRGNTTLLEMLSIIKNRCNILIAPDGGILAMVYYLDVFFPITIISLWADPRQGVLRQAVPSPNKGLTHIPLIGDKEDITNIDVDKVLSKIKIK